MGMKAKTIKAVLRKKADDWFASIEDENVRKAAKDNSIITGGAIASMLLGEPVNDFDVYFRSRDAALTIARYYVKRFEQKKQTGIPVKIFVANGYGVDISERDDVAADDAASRIKIVIKSAGIANEDGTTRAYEYFEMRPDDGSAANYVGEIMTDPGEIEDTYQETEEMALATENDDQPRYRPVFMSTNAITLSQKLQIVLRFFGEPDAIHANYDYVHCTNYWTSWNGHLVLRQDALESLLAKELRYVGSKYPVCSLFRLRKFIRRGWSINAGQILKIAMQVSALDLTSVHVLEDQLTGVDAAYFLEVINKLKEKDPTKIDSAYLVEIIDRMF